jgi:FKBP-type peptidyl-prolyl cis-trans isomerase
VDDDEEEEKGKKRRKYEKATFLTSNLTYKVTKTGDGDPQLLIHTLRGV